MNTRTKVWLFSGLYLNIIVQVYFHNTDKIVSYFGFGATLSFFLFFVYDVFSSEDKQE